MNTIKKIIAWIISLFKDLFGKSSTSRKKVLKTKKSVGKSDSKLKVNAQITSNDTMPSYMLLSIDGKENISEIKKKLFDDISFFKRTEIDNLIKNLHMNTNISKEDSIRLSNLLIEDIDKIDWKEITEIVNKYDSKYQGMVTNTYNTIIEKEKCYTDFNRDLDKMSNILDKHDVSIVTVNRISEEEDKLLNKKNIFNEVDDITYFRKTFYDVIDNYDKSFLDEVKTEYHKVNYVTITSLMIDKNITRFRELEENYRKHRFNKHYYEREINRIKQELSTLRDLKNKRVVEEELVRLRKELYTKSKDKYDILYNNEIFMSIDKQCDDLLNNINTKIVDIKKEKKEEKKQVEEKKHYLDNVILRFKDMELARKLIMSSIDEEDIDIRETTIINYLNKVFDKFYEGVNDQFNFDKNKGRTELVILYNDLNRLISTIRKEKFVPIEHINFRLDDLKEAVIYKKDEINLYLRDKYNYVYDDELINKRIYGNEKNKVKVKDMNNY